MSNYVKPKKHLGQHFLTNLEIAKNIVNSLKNENNVQVLEIGPGTGVLTNYLLDKNCDLLLSEIDNESITYLLNNYTTLTLNHFKGDFLKINISETFKNQVVVIGNFPYNISTQILFKVYENYDFVPELVGMFQKEVAERIASKPGNKSYGILSVLLQAYYDIEYLFTVSENDFNPPPKVKSGVIKMTRKQNCEIGCNESDFKTVVKTSFNQRRKTLRNSLKPFIPEENSNLPIFNLRPEQLSYIQFVELVSLLKINR